MGLRLRVHHGHDRWRRELRDPARRRTCTPRPAQVNPNNVGCQKNTGNGLTGASAARTRTAPSPPTGLPASIPARPFIEDEYDLSAYAGQENVVLRFSYCTDPGLDRPGWFIDDLKVTAGGQVIYQSDFTDEDELRLFPGGCGESRSPRGDQVHRGLEPNQGR